MQKKMGVAILLSTYNGERFIEQQLDSLLAQSYRDIHIFVRDDGSTDGTQKILQAYASQNSNFRWVQGENIGFIRSFLYLLHMCPDHFTYVFFCDQDDVWLPEKVARAIQIMELQDKKNQEILYCSRLQCVDSDLKPLHFSESIEMQKIGFGNALVQNVVTGCTVALNHRARQRLVAGGMPHVALAHDWWIYLVVSCFGQVVFDDQAMILYRQHGNNTIGMQRTGMWFKARKFLARTSRKNIFDQVQCFYALYGEQLPTARRQQVQQFLDYRQGWMQAWHLSVQPFFWRTQRVDGWMLRLLLALRCY